MTEIWYPEYWGRKWRSVPPRFTPIEHCFEPTAHTMDYSNSVMINSEPKRSCQDCRHYDWRGLDNLRYTWGCKLGMIEIIEGRHDYPLVKFDDEKTEKVFFALGCEEYDG